jgi:hypothetical protein
MKSLYDNILSDSEGGKNLHPVHPLKFTILLVIYLGIFYLNSAFLTQLAKPLRL